MKRRFFEENLFKLLMMVSLLIVMGSLAIIVALTVINGISSLNLEMVTQTPTGGYYLGKGGGILNAILGSLFLALPATGVAYMMGLGISLYLQRDLSRPRTASFIRLSLNILWGIPSIIYGVFCLMIMMLLGFGSSLIAGIVALTFLELPIITRYMDESIRTVPHGLKEGSYSLGSTKFETAIKVVRRQATPGIIAGVLLGLGRGIGDAASILFTAGFSDRIPETIFDSTAALPTMIYHLYSSPIPLVRQRAYAAALILLLIVLVLSILSRYLSRKFTKYIIG